MFSPEKRWLRGDLISVSPEGRVSEAGARLCSVVLGRRTRGNGQKLEDRKIHLNTRKNFTVQVLCALEHIA